MKAICYNRRDAKETLIVSLCVLPVFAALVFSAIRFIG
ncbi:hypothetical protein phiOC_p075 [Ochrobactrum phage vB_OspM_OC]|nr:hypothetical protein phiOC_p075 [Ochrobactrum phage vB_OspM_OC]